MNGKYQNNIPDLPTLESYRFENIFRVYETGERDYYFYNIIKKIELPDDLNSNYFDAIKLVKKSPLTTISYNAYGTMHLWWLILIVNNISNPVKNLPVGRDIRIVKPKYIKLVVDAIRRQL
jgi:hypothetical protein